MKSIFILFLSLQAFAGTEERTSEQTPFLTLYRIDAQIEDSKGIQLRFLNAFFQLMPILRGHSMTLNRWFREDHIGYLSDFLDDQEKKQMIPIFSDIGNRIKAGDRSMKSILVNVDSPLLIAKAAKIDSEVRRLKDMHKDVIRLALTKHEKEKNQPYFDLPYSYHLRYVRRVLRTFGFGPKDSLLGLKLGTAAWLHDALEDTDLTYQQLGELFGFDIAQIVLGVTKIEKREGLSPEDRIRLTLERTRKLKGSRILKLADRIANVEEGLLRFHSGLASKVGKYFDEWKLFREMLYVPGEADDMWNHLEKLLTDLPYAQKFATNNLHKFKHADCDEELDTSFAY